MAGASPAICTCRRPYWPLHELSLYENNTLYSPPAGCKPFLCMRYCRKDAHLQEWMGTHPPAVISSLPPITAAILLLHGLLITRRTTCPAAHLVLQSHLLASHISHKCWTSSQCTKGTTGLYSLHVGYRFLHLHLRSAWKCWPFNFPAVLEDSLTAIVLPPSLVQLSPSKAG